jgi:hypothetical protein
MFKLHVTEKSLVMPRRRETNSIALNTLILID